MNTKNVIPGFTAEASLHKAVASYQYMAMWINSANEPAIIPQRIKLQEWTCECEPGTDICVCTSEWGYMRAIHAVLGEL